MSEELLDIKKLKQQLSAFAKEREWDKFHSPKNIAMSLCVESAELLEIFQWLTEEASFTIKHDNAKFQDIKDEIADITMNVVRLCHILGVDLNQAIQHKFLLNAKKYPADRVKGSAKKYDEY